MSEYLPARQTTARSSEIMPRASQNGSPGLRDWLYSPLGRAVAQVLPDVLRLIGRREPEQSRPLTSHFLPSTDGANGMTVSEVEVDIDAPFIRRVVIRSASSWSVAPGVIKADQRRRRGRFGLSALTFGVLGIAGVVFARRSGISLPAGMSLPLPASLTRGRTSQRTTENPGGTE